MHEKAATANSPPACRTPPIKTSANLPRADQGTNAGSRVTGRKRHRGYDTPGLLLTALATAASVSDTAAGATLLPRLTAAHLRVHKTWVDAGYRTTAIEHSARLDIDVHPSTARPASAGSRSFRTAGPSSAASTGSCTTAASPVTTSDTRTARKP
ncbi:transposase [Streptomyces spectabilis]|uniref:Transposase IS4-like domain-containing protein n=1 Tax=Streptomyces spectabilis TaxID=68270 RepID=A0A7W8B736_STRST|nr:transposase [Streptomyces spectabilis]MBB5109778.1 hypothetical protein [Streptomyces spectabilis]